MSVSGAEPIAQRGSSRVPTGRRGRWRSEALLAYVFVLPAFVILLTFRLYPVVRAAYISLHQWGIKQEHFLGLKNYVTLFTDSRFWKSFNVTIFYVIVTVPITMAFSLLVAYLLFQKIRYRPVFRTLYFIPYITSLVPAAIVWGWIFNFESGILNHALGWLFKGVATFLSVGGTQPWIYVWVAVGVLLLVYAIVASRKRGGFGNGLMIVLGGLLLASGLYFMLRPEIVEPTANLMATFFPVKWLQEPRGIVQYLGKRIGFDPPQWLWGPSMALVAVSVVSIWHFLGYDVVVYLAGLGNIPPRLYEVARIDGANEAQAFWHITLPLLSPTTFFLLIISTIGAFRAFTLFYVMTGGGPLKTTTSVAYFIFDRFWNASRVGYASAAAFVLFGIILVMTVIQQKVVGERVTYQ
jgi:multiple sugar transport system permease protein